MPNRILLHIGSHKTGSTSIQNALTLSIGSGSSVCYPLWPDGRRFLVGGTSQYGLGALYLPYEGLPASWYGRYPANNRRFRTMRRRYRRFIFDELSQRSIALMSNEDFSYFTPDATRQLRKDLESAGFREFHIVLYIRDPADYFLSMMHSALKISLAVMPTGHDPASFKYEFLKTAETWEQVFPGSVTVRHYRGNSDFDVLHDFSAVVEQRLGVALPLSPMRRNTTLSAEGLQIMQDYRCTFRQDDARVATPDSIRLYQYLQNSTTNIRQTKPVLKAGVAEHIRANHQADAEVIRSRYGVDLGLQNSGTEARLAVGQALRVRDFVESVDPVVVNQLLLHLAKAELERPSPQRPLPTRIAARAYRRIRAELRR